MRISITMPSNIIKEEILSASSYQKGDRVVVRFDDEYYLGTVSKSGAKIYVRFDDGDKESFPKNSKKIIGIGVKQKRKKSFSKKNLDKYLKGRMKKSKSKKNIDWKDLKKNPNDYLDTVNTKQIISILKKASEVYYNTGENLISDYIYDLVEKELKNRDPNNKYLKKIGSPAKEGKQKLPYYMGSLSKVKPDDNSLIKWVDKYPGPYLVSDKMDGVSLLIHGDEDRWNLYTRGDGKKGLNVTHISPYLKLPKPKNGVAVRAEALMKMSTFKKYFKDTAANPRNLASGLLNRKDPDKKGSRNLTVIAYELINPLSKPSSQMKKLKTMGFKTAPHRIMEKVSPSTLTKLLESRKGSSSYEIDGLVIIPDKKYKRATSDNPKYSVAYKIMTSDQIGTGKVKKILWQTSKHGYLTPVIEIEPVKLGGVTIKHITAYNAKYILDNGIGKGSVIRFIRSGDVIPKITEVLKKVKPSLPNKNFEWTDSGVDIYLANKEESETVVTKLLTHFFRTIGLENIQLGIITKLHDNGMKTVFDIVNANKKKLMKVPGIQDKIADKIINGIKEALTDIPLYKLMFASNAFGRDLGSRRIKLVLDKYPKIMESNWDKEEMLVRLLEIPGFSDKLANAFIIGLPKFKKFMNKFPSDKVTIAKIKKKPKSSSSILDGEAICFTGFRDRDLQSRIENNGGTIKSGVSGNTTILLIKDIDSISSKARKARALGIKIMTPDTFVKKYGI